MKKLLLLPTILLTGLTPVISISGCNKPTDPQPPEPENVIDVNIWNDGALRSPLFTVEVDEVYTLVLDLSKFEQEITSQTSAHFINSVGYSLSTWFFDVEEVIVGKKSLRSVEDWPPQPEEGTYHEVDDPGADIYACQTLQKTSRYVYKIKFVQDFSDRVSFVFQQYYPPNQKTN